MLVDNSRTAIIVFRKRTWQVDNGGNRCW